MEVRDNLEYWAFHSPSFVANSPCLPLHCVHQASQSVHFPGYLIHFPSCKGNGIANMSDFACFTCILGIRTQVLTLMWQAFYPLSHLPSPILLLTKSQRDLQTSLRTHKPVIMEGSCCIEKMNPGSDSTRTNPGFTNWLGGSVGNSTKLEQGPMHFKW